MCKSHTARFATGAQNCMGRTDSLAYVYEKSYLCYDRDDAPKTKDKKMGLPDPDWVGIHSPEYPAEECCLPKGGNAMQFLGQVEPAGERMLHRAFQSPSTTVTVVIHAPRLAWRKTDLRTRLDMVDAVTGT